MGPLVPYEELLGKARLPVREYRDGARRSVLLPAYVELTHGGDYVVGTGLCTGCIHDPFYCLVVAWSLLQGSVRGLAATDVIAMGGS